MNRTLCLSLVLLFAAACSSEPPRTDPAIQKRNDELLKQHNQIWDLMGLSQKAKDELNGIVLGVNTQMMKNRMEKPDEYRKATEVKRSSTPPTHDEYIAAHRRRFDMLKISESTQKELLGGAEFVWSALHDKDAASKYTPEEMKVAQTIRDMMTKLGGPPPCCDDNIFQRAKGN